ncbi:MAG: ATP-dependent helicase RecG [Verrucomicrobiota bacterium]
MPADKTQPDSLDAPLRVLAGVGPERAAQLARLGLHTVRDLLLYPPARHEDRRHLLAIADVQLREAATVRGRVVATGTRRWRQRTRSVHEVIIDDGTARLHCRWWNTPYLEGRFSVGDELMVYGKPRSLRPRTIDHPETEVVCAVGEDAPAAERSIHLDRIVPIYGLTEGLPQRSIRALAWRALERFGPLLVDPHPALTTPAPAGAPGAAPPTAPLPTPGYAEAVRLLHFPDDLAGAERGRARLALDEFLDLQLAIQGRRRKLQAHATALPCAGDNHLIRPFLRSLGFPLTAAQTRVLRELRQDLGGRYPMRRLLQGDVGSGKTAVAACCALMALESGYNVALMAPTEILAEQHHANFSRWFTPLGVAVQLQTGSRKTAGDHGELPLANPANPSGAPGAAATPGGGGRLVIGTHALLTGTFQLERLGLVIIDEQHKFGVAQRETLLRKGRYPHLLVMTATPIPRTLGLTLYGDLDVSVIDELPPGRGVVRTFVRSPDQLPRVLEFIRRKLAEGRQAYVIYPRVEEADAATGVKAVTTEFRRLQELLAPHRVGLMHGRLRPAEKEAAMEGFRTGQVQVLLATSVVEVGVDVPNATVMLIENADQFGLAQLHQLRGRVGRGAQESWCILVAGRKTPGGIDRLETLASTTDGFAIAEADLRLRGPGELLGQQQSGLPPLRFGDLARDADLVAQARAVAATLLGPPPDVRPAPAGS